MNVQLLKKDGSSAGDIKLEDGVFGEKVRDGLLYEVVKMQLASRRSGNASTKTRGEVVGSGAKPFRQKGSGRARAGSKKSPIWRSGGVAFGPRPRDYSYKMPKRAVKEALKSALLYKIKNDELKVLESFELPEPKTRLALELLAGLKVLNGALIVTDSDNGNVGLSVRNLKGYKHIDVKGINVYDLLRFDDVIITKSAFEKVQEKLANK